MERILLVVPTRAGIKLHVELKLKKFRIHAVINVRGIQLSGIDNIPRNDRINSVAMHFAISWCLTTQFRPLVLQPFFHEEKLLCIYSQERMMLI